MSFIPGELSIGVLGGGQLGKMLAQEASQLDLNIHFLDKNKNYPAGKICPQFVEGDFNAYDDVINFGLDKKIVTIEIEHVNTKALHDLEKQGVLVFPQASILELIKDKGLQKLFYQENNFPTSPFALYNNVHEIHLAIQSGAIQFPFVQKLRSGGYDGRGVQVVYSSSDLNLLLEGTCLIEQKADIQKEISVIAVRNIHGECKVYPAVSMDFHPTANLVERLICPAEIPSSIEKLAEALAVHIAQKLEIVGLLAVEMFYNKDGSLWVNEMAPRPHNSGHHTLDNGATSQFANHLRAIIGLPLGDTGFVQTAIMLNVLGEDGYSGKAIYKNIEKILEINGVHLHLYGKDETRPFRKMGHITITGSDPESCRQKANFVSQTLKVIA
jgi:5-(carboxyamino)imidazole ribonucleotide synthase